MEKVADGSAFAQEFRIRNHIIILPINPMPAKDEVDPLIGIDWHRALLYDHLVTVDRTSNLSHYRLNEREIGCPVIALRGADGDKDRFALSYSLAKVRAELNPMTSVSFQHLRQVLFEDGNATV
jgi:hypothetical protein